MVSTVGADVGAADEEFSQRTAVAFGSMVEFSHRKLVMLAGSGALVVLSQRPVVMFGARVGKEVLSHTGLVLFAKSVTGADVFCHRGVVLL